MNNNFTGLRLLCASLVIITHSYELLGMGKDAFYYYSLSKVSLSHLAVNTFFVISGYLIFKSAERSKNVFEFIKKRFLRIYPAFFCAVIFSLIVAAVFYLGSTSFFLKNDTWSFLYRNLSILFLQHHIDGVFENHPIAAINGSLWTIPYEILCYAGVTLLIIVPFIKRYKKPFIITLFIMLFIINAYINITPNLMHELGIFPTVTSLGIYFLGGALMHYIKIQQINYRWLLILAIACLLCVKFSFWYMIFYIFWPIVIIGIGLASFPVINQVDKYVGDISYGIYLYAFPVQQALIALELVEQPIHLIWLSLLITSVLAKVSWEYVEKPFLKFKSKQLIQIK